MFEWLQDELKRIRTPKFHVVDGPLRADNRKLVEESTMPVSASYKAFVNRFGGAKLYRQGGIYLVTIFAVPIHVQFEDGTPMLQFSRTDRSLGYFDPTRQSHPTGESPVFEWYRGAGLRKASDGFEEWLIKKCKAARKLFSKQRWQAIENGPAPFTEREQGIVNARKRFKWRVMGIASNGDLKFEVFNGSDVVLPYLSIGVRGKNGKVDGGIWLSVSNVLPGETRIIQKGCYKEYLLPDEVEVFPEPDPGPEDRDSYWEFKVS